MRMGARARLGIEDLAQAGLPGLVDMDEKSCPTSSIHQWRGNLFLHPCAEQDNMQYRRIRVFPTKIE
jgi:hypothetical protein